MNSNHSLKIFNTRPVFLRGAETTSQLVNFNLAQIAFIGRSNVGKSSLINKICQSPGLARVSNTPGRTRQINFFEVGKKFVIADLPGYGFAKVSLKKKQEWENLIITYLLECHELKCINILVDSRRGIMNSDIEVIKLLQEHNKSLQIIFTKCDKISNRAK